MEVRIDRLPLTQIKKQSLQPMLRNTLKKLKTLDKEYTEALSQAKQKSFVTQHSAFAYLALDYGLTQVPISGVSAESDPSAKTYR